MPSRNARAFFCLLFAFVLFAGACTEAGGDRVPEATESETGVGPEDDVTPPDPQATSAVFDPTDEVLNVAIPEPASLDPLRIQDPGSVLVARQLYEGLTRWDPIEERVRPAAAKGWKVSNGGRTFTFKLRQGMTFHDGSPVTSRDFRYAFDRIALKENASDLAYTLDRVEGFTEVNQLGESQHLSGLRTPSDLVFQITLSEPFYDLPALLTHPALVPLSQRIVNKIDRFLSAPIGNGPFQIAEEWSPGQPVILEAFPGFIETPELDGIRFLPHPDAAASWLRFRDGELDVAEVPAGQIEDAEQAYGTGGFQPFLASYYYGFNLRSKALGDIRLRKAINRAIDRNEISTSIYKGTMTPPRGIVPAGMPGFQENICAVMCRYSPGVSRKLVKSLSKKERKVVVEFTKGDPHDDVARLVRRDLEEVGLQVKVRSFPFSKYLRRLRDQQQSVYRLGWIAEFPVPDVFLSPLFRSDSPDNHSGFSSQKVDTLLTKAHAEPSDGRRVQLYIQAEKEILKQVPVAPIGSFVTHWATQSRVKDLRFDVMGGFDAVNVFLEAEDQEG
ncbi:MAG: peptide ABC transporter substrate-binding protein [Actinomycetota bacterium]|nr:peptide ABC transporter substrate-binding protein [Actinomycetota bacterium]